MTKTHEINTAGLLEGGDNHRGTATSTWIGHVSKASSQQEVDKEMHHMMISYFSYSHRGRGGTPPCSQWEELNSIVDIVHPDRTACNDLKEITASQTNTHRQRATQGCHPETEMNSSKFDLVIGASQNSDGYQAPTQRVNPQQHPSSRDASSARALDIVSSTD